PPCGRYEFHCGSGECRPRGWVCDDEADCLDGSDELVCNRTCGLDQHTCAVTAECIPYGQLCDGIPQCWDQSDESTDNCGSTEIPPCPGLFVCNNRMCVNVSRVCDGSHDCPQGEDELACDSPSKTTHSLVSPPGSLLRPSPSCPLLHPLVRFPPYRLVCNGLADCADGSEASGWLPSDEQDCGLWSPWAPWSTCSRSCGMGLQIRRRVCTRRANDVLRHCHGEETQAQQCFALACPGETGLGALSSIQWSFRSPNNPSKHGNGRQCRGIYRKARRCQTDPCEECEHHGRLHAFGDRWRSGQCQVCQCLPNLTVQCSQYCPYSTVGCPEGRALMEGSGEACCYCAEAGESCAG
ncbi:SCO-spondin-like, partial [Chelonoidis abingdonii]|uniref:SCO-spondin-like n=1 Tax=Chelonoidis abingdonii TaxID=106734 RepID=UPI003F499DD2